MKAADGPEAYSLGSYQDDSFSGDSAEVQVQSPQALGADEQDEVVTEGNLDVTPIMSGMSRRSQGLSGAMNDLRDARSRREGYSLEDKDAARLGHKLNRQASIKSSASFFSALSAGSVGRPISDARTRSLQQVMKELSNLKTSKGVSCCGEKHNSKDYWIRTECANYLFGFVIIVNAAYLGFETDTNRPNASIELPQKFWTIVESCFLSIFLLELALRFRADCWDVFRDFWGFFDTVIVLLGVIDTFVFQFVFGEDTAEDLQTLSLFRLGRLVRIARVLRILRLLRFVRELLLLVKGLLGALKALIWAFLLIVMVLFISAIFVTEIIRIELDDSSAQDAEEISIWFGDVGKTVLTLSQIMTLEGWPRIVRVVCLDGTRPWLLFFFFPFLCCTNFALLNVVTAVMVEKVFEFAEDEKTNEVKSLHRSRRQNIQKVCKLFTDIDEDGNGSLSAAEMKVALQDADAMKQFQELGIAKHDIDTLFQCLDIDGNGELSIEEFIEGCLRMHGNATSSDLLRVHYDVHRSRKSMKITKLSRHMMWSAWCLNDDYSKSKAGQRHRGKVRAKTIGPAIQTQQRHSAPDFAAPDKLMLQKRNSPLMLQCNKTDPTQSRTSNESSLSKVSQKSEKGMRTLSAKRLSAVGATIQQSLASLGVLVKKDDDRRKRRSAGDLDMLQQQQRLKVSPRRVSDITGTVVAKAKSPTCKNRSRNFAPEELPTSKSDTDAKRSDRLPDDMFTRHSRAAKRASKNGAMSADSSPRRAKARSSTMAASIGAASEKQPSSPSEKQQRPLTEHDVLLPAETTELLEEVVAEQRQMRDLLQVLGTEVRTIRGQVKQWMKEPKAEDDGDVLLPPRSSSQPLSNFMHAPAGASLLEPVRRSQSFAGATVGATKIGHRARDVF